MTSSSRWRGAAACWSCSHTSPPAPTTVWAANPKGASNGRRTEPHHRARPRPSRLGAVPRRHPRPARRPAAGTLHPGHVDEHHYAFQLNDDEFEAAFGRIRDRGITYYADPACRRPGKVYANVNGARGAYFRDPNGHLMEILTPVSGEPA